MPKFVVIASEEIVYEAEIIADNREHALELADLLGRDSVAWVDVDSRFEIGQVEEIE